MEWGSFVWGLLAGGFLFGGIGIIIGGLAQMASRGQKRQSELSNILHEAGIMLPKGELVSFTIGHDVCVPEGCDEGGSGDKFWERN